MPQAYTKPAESTMVDRAPEEEAGEEEAGESPLETHLVEFTVEPNYAGWRLDRYLAQKLRRLSRTRIQTLIRKQWAGQLKPSTLVQPGMRLSLQRSLPREPAVPGPEALSCLFEDEDLLVVDKPSGLPVHPTARYFHNTLVAQLAKRYPRPPAPAHRLDRETSGLLLCTKTTEASRQLGLAFASAQVYKEYLALSEGHPACDAFSVEAPIAEGSAAIRIAVRISPEGKAATTRVYVLRRFWREGAPFCLLRCIPLTGRQHQIRVHLKHAGFALVGDKIYGPDEMFFDRFSRHCLEAEAMARLRLWRHALHASVLEFRHPRTQAPLRFESALPEDLKAFLEGGDVSRGGG
jgi:23S rRNA pseudouridine1911/1915/1917 synthase